MQRAMASRIFAGCIAVLPACIALAVGAVACGSSGGGGSPGDSGPDATEDTGADGSPAPDAAPEAGPDGGPADGAPSDAGPLDSAPDVGPACPLDGSAIGILCDGVCIDDKTDPQNCGGCGASYACGVGSACAAGQCTDVAGVLSGLRWNLPCTVPTSSAICTSKPDGGTEVVVEATLGGAAGARYAVELRLRGVAEQRTYLGSDAGGAQGAEPEGGADPGFFVIGGPPAGAGDSANIYELDISDPPQTYYLNSGKSSAPGVYLLDYLAHLPMNAGAKVTLKGDTVDGLEYSNHGADGGPVIPPGVPPAPAAYDGQFVQMDVVSVTPAP
jgi:hypothetical protein